METNVLLKVANFSELHDRQPAYALALNTDLVVVRHDDQVSVLYGRCLHRGALMADGHIEGDDLICGVHGWDYRFDTGVSSYANEEALHKFEATIDLAVDAVFIAEADVRAFEMAHPQPYDRTTYLGLYQDVHGAPEEDQNGYIQQLARDGLQKLGHHGRVSAMG
ncbi:MAG: Rieske (2Fe-2S) protein, partial [Myxococcota bacterium]